MSKTDPYSIHNVPSKNDLYGDHMLGWEVDGWRFIYRWRLTWRGGRKQRRNHWAAAEARSVATRGGCWFVIFGACRGGDRGLLRRGGGGPWR